MHQHELIEQPGGFLECACGYRVLRLTRKNRPRVEMDRSELSTKVVATYMWNFATLPWYKRLWNWIRAAMARSR